MFTALREYCSKHRNSLAWIFIMCTGSMKNVEIHKN